MNIIKNAQAGTMQSSDLMVFVEPSDSLAIEIESSVLKQFGHLIREKAEQVLAENKVEKGLIKIIDRGALDYAIEARIETAIQRSRGE
jgi:citrate lyase subunit gamma (acyl carrier protein)